MNVKAATPLKLGYAMPAEWERHEATWMTWPHAGGISFPGQYDRVIPVFVRMVDALAGSEEVRINVNDRDQEREVLGLLRGVRHDHVRFFHIPSNEPWCRDHGPIFVRRDEDPRLAVIDWGYNAWGYKYPPFDLDDNIPTRVAELLGLPCFAPDMVLEGGSIDVNGNGLLMSTESCLLHPNRNPEMSRRGIERLLRDYLGVSKFIWLGDGIVGDDTDGHIDVIARFVNERTILAAVEDDPDDENHGALRDNLDRLDALRIPGHPLTVEPIPMPSKILRDGQRLPASYANFYIANTVVLMPSFADPNDKLMHAILRKHFPDREVIAIDSRDLVWGLGSFHCLTQQQPAV